MSSFGRNDLCPCGSGQKYKKCCLGTLQIPVDDLAWQRVHNSHKQLVHKLAKFTVENYGPEGYAEAWEEFNLWEAQESFDPGSPFHPMFGPWMFYHWSPDEAETPAGDQVPAEVSPAHVFLKRNRTKLTDLEIEDLYESLSRPLSFYVVLESNAGSWVKVQDIFTEEYHTVIEKMGSKAMHPGDVLFGKVVTIQNVSMFDGLAPLAFPPYFHLAVLQIKEEFEKQGLRFVGNDWREADLELLEIFWDFYETLTNPPQPILKNTDGHVLAPHIMEFAIESTQRAFDALHTLNFDESREEILERAKTSKRGAAQAIDFPWLVKGNKQNKHWNNTVLGHIRIEGKKLFVEVNSKERTKKFLTLLKKRMPEGWKHLSTKAHEPSEHEAGSVENGIEDINELPEVKAYIAKMNEAHWQNWLLMSIPALNGQTPVEAVKTKKGRIMLDALITDFERSASIKPLPGQDLETFKRLRARLGL